jgi:hypothetical protein
MVRKVATIVAFAGAIAAGSALSAHASTLASVIGGVRADSVTGCLQKGDAKGTYSVTDAMGHKHWVSSKNLPLDKHVGHTVTLAGSSMMSDNKMSDNKMGSDTGMKMTDNGKMADKTGGMSSPMDVTTMTMVSASCK